MSREKPKIYLNNKLLYPEVVKCQENGNRMSEELGKMFILLVDKYGSKANFASYTYNEDMRGYALVELCKNWHKFDALKYSNAFAYFTSCVTNSFLQFLNRETYQRNVRDQLLCDAGLEPSHTFTEKARMKREATDT